MKAVIAGLVLLVSSAALAGTKFVGGGLEIGPTAPVFVPAPGGDAVQVSQILYTQVELGFTANTHIIDVAWRKEGLGPVTSTGGCGVQVFMKNVTRQMGPFTVGTTQTLTDALQNAQKVIDKPASSLPTTMGFVTLDVIENQFDFVYLGDSLEVTIITDCRPAAQPFVDAAITWRYDSVPERVRVASGETTDGLVLTAEPLLSSFRPHTRFRTLVETPGIELRVAGNVLPNGGAFAVAPKHFAAGLPANFAFQVVNPSTVALVINSIAISNLLNGAAISMPTTPVTVMPGQTVDVPFVFGPTLAGSLSRFTITWNTSAGTWTNTFQGTPTATAETQPAGSVVKPDGTTQSLTAGTTPLVLQVGTVPPAHSFLLELIASNYGQGMVEAHAEPVSGDVQVVTPSTMVGAQQDVRIITRARAPVTPGPFTTEARLVVGALTFQVRETGVVAAPDLKVSVGGVEITNGSTERITRPGPGAFDRVYRFENLGAVPLFFSTSPVRTDGARNPSYPTPGELRVLGPAQGIDLTFAFEPLNTLLEPFTFKTSTNDPDGPIFSWLATTALAGRKQLAVSIEENGDYFGKMLSPREGDALMADRTRALKIEFANVGDEALTITSLGERCRACKDRPPLTLPLTLQPGEALTREIEFDASWHLEYAIESDAEGSPLQFSIDGTMPNCAGTVAPGPIFLAMSMLWLWRRRSRR